MMLKDTNEIFADDLRDPEYASGYLNIALEEDGIEGFLYALQKVARAHGMTSIATRNGMPRESLYRSLSGKGNPGIKPLTRILDSMGLQITITRHAPHTVSASATSNDSVSEYLVHCGS